MKRPAFLLALAIALAATSAIAQTMPATTQATTRPRGDLRTLTVSPMAVPVPALKYPLRIAFADQLDGNAAPLYLQAFAEVALDSRAEAVGDAAYEIQDDVQFAQWVADHAAWLDTTVPPLIATATLRGDCDWAIPIRYENFRALVPFLNHARATADLLHAKFRLAIDRSEVDQALRLVQADSVLADRVDDGNTFIVNDLVAVGIQSLVFGDTINRLIQRPDAPNLYWSMRAYPVPFGNLRRTLECEQATLFGAFPVLRKARDGAEITADDWRQFIGEATAYADAQRTATIPAANAIATDAVAGAAAMVAYGPAKKYYAQTRNLSDAQVAKIEPLKVVATFAIESYEQSSDELYKWFALPYPQMLPGVERAQAKLKSRMSGFAAMTNLFLTIAPSLNRIGITNARLDRTIAAITVIESLRAYAAAHEGTLPPTLDAIVETPAPMNPVTGKPFDYAVNGDVATIGDDGKLVDWPLRYEVRLRH